MANKVKPASLVDIRAIAKRIDLGGNGTKAEVMALVREVQILRDGLRCALFNAIGDKEHERLCAMLPPL